MSLTVGLDVAAKICAELVREGVTFQAVQNGPEVIIKFTGGF